MRITEHGQDRPWHKLVREDALTVGQLRMARIGIRQVVIARTENGIRIYRNQCPHAGAPLSGGRLDGEHIICPRHQWAFCVDDGQCPEHPLYALRPYNVQIKEGWVYAQEQEEEIW